MQILITENDLKNIWGKYIFQIEPEQDDLLQNLISKSNNKEFYFIKRINTYYKLNDNQILCCGLLGDSWIMHKTSTEFVDYINNYVKISSKQRIHRFLAANELDHVFEYVKKRYFINLY